MEGMETRDLLQRLMWQAWDMHRWEEGEPLAGMDQEVTNMQVESWACWSHQSR